MTGDEQIEELERARVIRAQAKETLNALCYLLNCSREYHGIEYGRKVAKLMLPAFNRYCRRCEKFIHLLMGALKE